MAIDLPGVGGGMGGGAPENDPVDTGGGNQPPGGSGGGGGGSDSPYGTPRLGNIPSPTFDPRNPLDPITTDAPDGVDLDAGTTVPEATGNAGDDAPNNDPAGTDPAQGIDVSAFNIDLSPIAMLVAVAVAAVALIAGS